MNSIGNIAIVGAPGTGKSRLAGKIWEHENSPHQAIVDGYADRVAEASSLALGIYATYVGNWIVAAARLQEEVRHVKDETPYIVCGSLIDTAAYMSVRGSIDQRVNDEVAYNRTVIFSQLLAALMNDTLVYSHYLYLPLGDSENVEHIRFDEALQSALDLFKIPYFRVNDPNDIEAIMETLESSSTEE